MTASASMHGGVETEQCSERIGSLLEEVRAVAGPVAWPRVEALVAALVELYGSGLERLLEHARASAAGDEQLLERLAADELVTALLSLHGLHPQPLEARVAQALAATLREHGAAPELVGIADGVVTLRGAAAPIARRAARAIAQAAPEIVDVKLEDPGAGWVSVERLRRREGA